MAASGTKDYGAPSQRTQPSRKGKKAWRKNVDIGGVEESLETMREEERVTGSALQKKTNDELFQVDLKGDDKVVPKTKKLDFSQLKSAKILAQRSAVPAVVSRLTSKEKDRMLRSVKRKRQDPLDSVVKQLPFGAGSAPLDPSAAVKKSGQYDVWDAVDSDQIMVEDLTADQRDFIEPLVKKRKVKAPSTLHPHKSVDVTPILTPHEGTSYNPPVHAYNDLVKQAVSVEEHREADSQRYDAVHASMTALRLGTATASPGVDGTGMILDIPSKDTQDEHDADDTDVVVVAPRLPKRKTLQQRKKAAKLRAEKAIADDKTARKRLLAQMDRVKSLRKDALSGQEQHRVAMAARKEALLKKQRGGLAGQKLGRHKVAVGAIDVQLGDELRDSLRNLKPEGNLFRDRFQSMQHRALVEPRVRAQEKQLRFKDYELHSFKNFDVKKNSV
ncbi:P60-like protein [Auriculariales sp. MPI-PUGE-AT-0066]|nr:P60-like protein [Auriculariales sp. MPI-PUGE-AT-0066]